MHREHRKEKSKNKNTQHDLPAFEKYKKENIEALYKKRRKAKVGLELAFNDDFTRKNFGNEGYTETADYNLEQIQIKAEEYRAKWVKKAEEDAANNNWNIEISYEDHPQGKEHIFGQFGRTRFIYSGLNILDENSEYDSYKKPADMSEDQYNKWVDFTNTEMEPYSEGTGKWWWGLTIDPGVFELQSKPTSWQVINNTQVRTIITDTIFGGAGSEQLGLKADKGWGGGQINIDFTTGLKGSYDHVLTTISNQENMHEYFSSSNLNEDDDLNGPYLYHSQRVNMGEKDTPITDERIKEEWGKLYKQYYGKITDADEWNEFINEYNELLRKYPSSAQRTKDYLKNKEPFFTADAHQDDIFHYQALNIGHISEEDPGARRLEFRDLRAQGSIDDILNAIDLTLAVIIG